MIVVTGEALVDLVLAPDGGLRGHPGGGPYNVARSAGRLGAPVTYLGRVSTDGFGERLRRALAADGVDLRGAIPTDDPTTLALAELDPSGAATYRFYSQGTSSPGLTAAEAAGALPDDTTILCLGTLGLVFEPLATTLEALAGRLADDVLVALDPNCRPTAIADPAAYRGRLARLAARSDVVKASADDLAWIAPGERPAQAIRGLLRDGAAGLVTLGADGALVVPAGGDDVRTVAAAPVDVVDTIGAGDAFMGAFLARWQARGRGRHGLGRLDDVVDAAAFACEVAALTCTRAGADPPRLEELRTAG